MTSGNSGLMWFDGPNFNPWRIHAIRHRLASHPLLQPDCLTELGERLEAKGRVRTHSNAATAGTSFVHAPSLHPNRQGAASTLANIAGAGAWMSLLNVQTDPLYRTLVDDGLESIRPDIEQADPGMCYRGGWIFVTSPRTITPFHFDTEHGILVQILGRKRIYAWDHTDTVVASEKARDLFFAHHNRDLLVWKDDFKQRARVFNLEPGMGCYMPSTTPHLVEVGDEPSVTMSFTFYTNSTRRKSLLHRAHQRLRESGIEMAPVGNRPIVDALLHAGWRMKDAVKQTLRRLGGKTVIADNAPYAHHLFS